MITALIVENEPQIADHLLSMVHRNFSDLKIVGVCPSVLCALESIERDKPDIVFLDVELNSPETGFDILRNLTSIDFKIIFTTAYDQYALRAIKFSALDFLLKPIDEDELRTAISKFVAGRSFTTTIQQATLLSYQPGNQEIKIGLPVLDGSHFVPVKDILYCEGGGAQTYVYLKGGKKYLVSRTLRECEDMLEPFDFCRIHKSYLINLYHIEKYHKGDGGCVDLNGGYQLDISKTYKDEFLLRLKRL